MADHDALNPWRFEAPIDRAAQRLRAWLGIAGSAALCVAAAECSAVNARTGALVALVFAFAMGLFGLLAWHRSKLDGAPLVLDERGLWYQDGLTGRMFVAWEELEDVTLRGGALARRVLLVIRDVERSEVVLPSICCADAPPEWTAGLIETFRQHALHRG